MAGFSRRYGFHDEILLALSAEEEATTIAPLRASVAWKMVDKLDFDAISALPVPLLARFCGGDIWPIYDIDVETGLMRIDVCGLLQVMHFADVMEIRDADGRAHDSDDFWLDEPVA